MHDRSIWELSFRFLEFRKDTLRVANDFIGTMAWMNDKPIQVGTNAWSTFDRCLSDGATASFDLWFHFLGRRSLVIGHTDLAESHKTANGTIWIWCWNHFMVVTVLIKRKSRDWIFIVDFNWRSNYLEIQSLAATGWFGIICVHTCARTGYRRISRS